MESLILLLGQRIRRSSSSGDGSSLLMYAVVGVIARFFGLWLQAFMSRANVKLVDLIGMRLRKVNPRIIVLCKIRAVKGGLDISTEEMVGHYLAGGDVPRVIDELCSAKQANCGLSWETACKKDLAEESVDTPEQGTASLFHLLPCS